MVTHTKERSYACLTCQKTYSSSSALAKHRRIHDPFKPYCCPISACYKSFTQLGHLQKHLKSSTHTPLNVCEICDRNFRLPNTLIKHMKTHNEEVVQVEPDEPKTIIISDEILVPASMEINELFFWNQCLLKALIFYDGLPNLQTDCHDTFIYFILSQPDVSVKVW